MDVLNSDIVWKPERPIKVLQFGEGNFLRGFVDYMLDITNENTDFNGNVVLVKPINSGNLDYFYQQDCLYTVSLRGLLDGEEMVTERIITSITDAIDPYKEYERYAKLAQLDSLRFVVSNTTEAGIIFDEKDSFDLCPPRSFPGKLTKFLFDRYLYFKADREKGLIVLPVELIDDNGLHLKEIVIKLAKLWNLEDKFVAWVENACIFCSTLVDRIITGYPKEEEEKFWESYGYVDHLIVTGEPFASWVIESEKEIEEELPLIKAGLPVIFTKDQKPYKLRKVRILNGAHTSFALASFLAGNDYVLESMEDKDIHRFMKRTIFEEIIPGLNLPKEELLSFAEAVTDRFMNPYIKHALLSISLNSVSKWKARCMPSLLIYIKQFAELPTCLTFSLAALMEFYYSQIIRDGVLIGCREGKEYRIIDDREVLEFFAENSSKVISDFVCKFLSNIDFWGWDLTEVPFLTDQVVQDLTRIRSIGIREAMRSINYETII